MKVSDFQKHLRALAEIIATKTPSKELSDAADALNAFAHYKMTDFAKFLQLAEAKYASTGELPDAKGAKPAKEPSTKKEAAPKTPAPTVDELIATVGELKVRIRTDQSLSRDGVASALARFEKLSKPDLVAATGRLGLTTKPKTKVDAIATIVSFTIAAQAGIERSDA